MPIALRKFCSADEGPGVDFSRIFGLIFFGGGCFELDARLGGFRRQRSERTRHVGRRSPGYARGRRWRRHMRRHAGLARRLGSAGEIVALPLIELHPKLVFGILVDLFGEKIAWLGHQTCPCRALKKPLLL